MREHERTLMLRAYTRYRLHGLEFSDVWVGHDSNLEQNAERHAQGMPTIPTNLSRLHVRQVHTHFSCNTVAKAQVGRCYLSTESADTRYIQVEETHLESILPLNWRDWGRKVAQLIDSLRMRVRMSMVVRPAMARAAGMLRGIDQSQNTFPRSHGQCRTSASCKAFRHIGATYSLQAPARSRPKCGEGT